MRKKGEGSVYRPTYRDKRGNLKHSSVWWINFRDKQGKSHFQSAQTRNKSDAVRVLKRRLAEVALDRFTPPAIEKVTFDDLAKILLNDYRVNKRRSLVRLQGSIRNLDSFFGGDKVLTITSDRILAYVSYRQEAGAANATINRELAALKRMFRLGYRAEKVLKIPHISLLREDNARKGFFEPDQLEAVLTHLPQDIQPVVQVAYLTGWRVRSEILTRRWHHLDFGHGWLRLEPGETKNQRGRMFPLTSELRDVLEAQRERTDRVEKETGQIIPWVFHREGKPIKTFDRSWKTACREAGVTGKLRHDFRRTAVRNLERAGVPRSTAMAMVGHETESMYRRYAIVDEGMLREGAAKLSALHESERNNPRKIERITKGRSENA